MSTSAVTDIPDHHHPVVIVMEEIEAEEEIPESSKEVEAVEEIFHHKGWIPIKYRWEWTNILIVFVNSLGNLPV